jgi:hypothetical protein
MFIFLGIAVYVGAYLLGIIFLFLLFGFPSIVQPSVLGYAIVIVIFFSYHFILRKMLKYIPSNEFYPEVFWCVVLLILLFIISRIFDFLKTPIMLIGEWFGMSRLLIFIINIFLLNQLYFPFSEDGWIVNDLLLVFYLVLYEYYLRNFRENILKHIKAFLKKKNSPADLNP